MTDDRSFEPGTEQPPAAETQAYVPANADRVSDVKPADSVTARAPSFRPPAAGGVRVPMPPERRDLRPPAMLPGTEIDDFQVIRMLGRGAFGHVYLARQLSLDREVALKVSANQGSEGRTMARLEHAHIVQVFSETVDVATNQRLLCMQLVPGVGLERIIASLGESAASREQRDLPASSPLLPASWTGADFLAVIDRNASLPTALDPASLRDREALGQMDAVEATAWLGARLAEALDFAHRRGVLHRDIKPANILVNSYGRPMLADFNISAQQVSGGGDEDDMFGGTIAYMAPEHLDAFNPSDVTPHDAVTQQADIYSLGLVLHELLFGARTPFSPNREAGMAAMLRRLADERRSQPPICRAGPPDAWKTLERTICRCLAPEPADRFFSGAELAEQLDGCRQLRQAERRLPKPTPFVNWIVARPFFWFVWLVLLPHIAGSMINITYNTSQIVRQLSPDQQRSFMQLVTAYNVVIYPLAVMLITWVVLRVRWSWRAMHGVTPLAAGRVADTRRKALRMPLWVAGGTACGWLPGAVLFPAVITAQTEPLSLQTWVHFVASFTLSGVIALAYSLCASQFIVQRALYPRMWDDVRHFTATTRQELAPTATRLSWIQGLAGSIPLLAAGLFIWLPGAEADAVFKTIVTTLIFLGAFGYHLTTHVTRSLTDTTVALTGAKA